jgi:hypothetical protein
MVKTKRHTTVLSLWNVLPFSPSMYIQKLVDGGTKTLKKHERRKGGREGGGKGEGVGERGGEQWKKGNWSTETQAAFRS